MLFELLSWIFISLVCSAWGSLFMQFLFRQEKESALITFPVIVFMGMFITGLICLYFSLFGPLYNWIKFLIFFAAIIYYLNRNNRKYLSVKIRISFQYFRMADFLLFFSIILMILCISSSQIIHPDSLNYHVDAIRLYSHYGMIPGIANFKSELGFQSLWFIVMNLFDFAPLQPGVSFPLSGCVLSWFVLFVISKSSGTEMKFRLFSGWFWKRLGYLLLLIFTLLSWTQIRLTAASASPDFVVAICIFCSFFFLIQKSDNEQSAMLLCLSVFFALIAVVIKMSSIAMLLLPFFVFLRYLKYGDKKLIFFSLIASTIILTPLLIRNFVSAGYPLYPSSLGGFFQVDWKMHANDLEHFQKYITDYARLQIVSRDVTGNFDIPINIWFPKWWSHLYIPDKLMLLTLVPGVAVVLVFFKKWTAVQTIFSVAGFLIACTGFIIWFVNAPDPRFGTGFILPLCYFMYFPLLNGIKVKGGSYAAGGLRLIKYCAIVGVFIYSGFRVTHFFQFSQLWFPVGVVQKTNPLPDCEERKKNMLFNNGRVPPLYIEGTKTYRFRGKFLKEGFKPPE